MLRAVAPAVNLGREPIQRQAVNYLANGNPVVVLICTLSGQMPAVFLTVQVFARYLWKRLWIR
jgi:hypothetical protein